MSDLPTHSQPAGLAPNVAGALAYLLGPITGILFLVIEKKSRFVRFHAAQSVIVSAALMAASIVVGVLSAGFAAIPILGWIVALFLSLLGMLLGVAGFVLWIVLMIRAFNGQEWSVPGASAYVQKLLVSPTLQ